jgi:hypothetical protein
VHHKKLSPRSNWRFHRATISAILKLLQLADEMTQEIASTSCDNDTADAARVRPRAYDYYWRPWYAKLWWILATALGLLLVTDATVVRFIPRSVEGWQVFIALALHPGLIVPVLGFNFARDWINYLSVCDPHEMDADDGFDDLSSPLNQLDPFDPRFNALPNNPGSPTWRERHGWNGN